MLRVEGPYPGIRGRMCTRILLEGITPISHVLQLDRGRKKEEKGSDQYDFYMNQKFIPIYSKDVDMLIKVSNAFNIQVNDKVVVENFCSQLVNVCAKWIERGRPHPNVGSQRHDFEFKVLMAL